jgi:hypothetical protein
LNNHEEADTEGKKLELERQRMEFERYKFDQQKKIDIVKSAITSVSIIVPILIAALTIQNSIHLQDLHDKQESNLANLTARNDFMLKSAELVMDADSPIGTQNRARALSALFPQYLGSNFANSFDASRYGVVLEDGEYPMYNVSSRASSAQVFN